MQPSVPMAVNHWSDNRKAIVPSSKSDPSGLLMFHLGKTLLVMNASSGAASLHTQPWKGEHWIRLAVRPSFAPVRKMRGHIAVTAQAIQHCGSVSTAPKPSSTILSTWIFGITQIDWGRINRNKNLQGSTIQQTNPLMQQGRYERYSTI